MQDKISAFTLERYRLGELPLETMESLKEALAGNEEFSSRLNSLEESDRELRLKYPVEYFDFQQGSVLKIKRRKLYPFIRFAGIAAALALFVIIPVVYYFNVNSTVNAAGIFNEDRAKGTVPAGIELTLFLKGEREILIEDQTLLKEGNTVQLAYSVPAGEHYGVIFSIDGRAQVTMHYPYREGESCLLVSGKRTFLDEAYTLDDAPFYEVFVIAVSESPLDVEHIFGAAKKTAQTLDLNNLNSAWGKSSVFGTAFENCEVNTLMVLK